MIIKHEIFLKIYWLKCSLSKFNIKSFILYLIFFLCTLTTFNCFLIIFHVFNNNFFDFFSIFFEISAVLRFKMRFRTMFVEKFITSKFIRELNFLVIMKENMSIDVEWRYSRRISSWTKFQIKCLDDDKKKCVNNVLFFD